MRVVLSLLALALHGVNAFVPSAAPLRMQRCAVSSAPVYMSGLEDAMASVSKFFAGMGKGGKGGPTAEEIAEYCRDPESSGCDVEMMDALMAEAEKLNKLPQEPKPRWSADIDEAVAKCD